tara:strand:+ start:4329 stop:5234 length:906 start_codon:yes stop_codon:yes gene_type:complete
MFLNKSNFNYNIDLHTSDISLHNGVPKNFSHLKDKNFGDWEIPPWELFIFESRLLGEGSFAKVYLAKWRETFVVAKVINENIAERDKELVMREFKIMTKLHHPNIVQFLGYINKPFIIVMEYIPKLDIDKNINSLKKYQKIDIMKDILRGLAYIHNRRPYSLIHRDIKPTNILLTNSKVAKITDFGLSKFYNLEKSSSYDNIQSMEKTSDSELTNFVGTERYMAPEVKDKLSYANKADIYSCGILIYELFENKKYIINGIMQWYYTPKKIKKIIIDYMICENPDNRLPAMELLKLLNIHNV